MLQPDLPFIKRVAVHFGVHIAYWPTRVPWGSVEETNELVKLGLETIIKADLVNYAWLEGTMLAPLFPRSGGSAKRVPDSRAQEEPSKRHRDDGVNVTLDGMEIDV